MKYREFLKEQEKIIKRIGEKKYNIVLTIFKETNGKISFKEALEIVSKISDNEIHSIQPKVMLVTDPHAIALFLGEAYKVLLGKAELKGYKESDFELNDRLVFLFKCYIGIYIPNGEYEYR